MRFESLSMEMRVRNGLAEWRVRRFQNMVHVCGQSFRNIPVPRV